jgi:hypothetical protein
VTDINEIYAFFRAYYAEHQTCPQCRNACRRYIMLFLATSRMDPSSVRCRYCGWVGPVHAMLPRDEQRWRRRMRRYKVKSSLARHSHPWHRLLCVWHVWYVRAQMAARGFQPNAMRGKSVWQMNNVLLRR